MCEEDKANKLDAAQTACQWQRAGCRGRTDARSKEAYPNEGHWPPAPLVATLKLFL